MVLSNGNRIVLKHRKNIQEGQRYWSIVGGKNIPALGDTRWTRDLILSTWYMSETGKLPDNGMENNVGASKGGFDVLDFKYLPVERWTDSNVDIDLSISLDSHKTTPEVCIPIPFYGGGMSYGSVSENVMLSRAKAAQKWKTFTSTGSGGFPASLMPYRENIITQVVAAMFGVREETIQEARIVELQYSQGAKPGLGGHMRGERVTELIARMRETTPGVSLQSPSTFQSVSLVEDQRKQIDWIKAINPNLLISVKIAATKYIELLAISSYYAGADIIHVDGSYGGTAGGQESAKKKHWYAY